MDDIASQYRLKLDEFDREIKKVENKAKKAMRFVLWMKVILSIISR